MLFTKIGRSSNNNTKYSNPQFHSKLCFLFKDYEFLDHLRKILKLHNIIT